MVKPTGHSHGSFIYTQSCAQFILDFPQKTNNEKYSCNGSLFTSDFTKPRKLLHIIDYSKIKLILKRRYYYKKNALEIFTKDHKSYYFVFNNQSQRDEIHKLIVDAVYRINKKNLSLHLEKISLDIWKKDVLKNIKISMLFNNQFQQSLLKFWKKKS